MHGRKLAEFNLWLMLGALVSILAWLAPDKAAPWRAFSNEWLAAVALLPLAVWIGTRRETRSLPIPVPAIALLAVATVPLWQGLAGQIRFGGDALLAVLYLCGVSLATVMGHAWRVQSPSSVNEGLPLTGLMAALASLGLASMQWLQVDVLGVMLVALPPEARPTSNIGQANHVGTLMAWGLVALWWLYEGKRIGNAVAAITALCLLFGVAMSQSRTGWLHVTVLALATLMIRPRLNLRVSPLATMVLVALFVAMVLGWERINTGLQLTVPLTIEQQTSAGPRLGIWRQFATAAAVSPWVGFGWTQGGLAQQAVLLELPPLNIVTSSAHNLVLDLIVWQGIPLTLVMLAASTYWSWLRLRRITTIAAAMCAVALALLSIHSMLEFPHEYAYFLLPAALLVGVIEADTQRSAGWSIPRRAWLLTVGVVTAMLLWLGSEYLVIRDNLDRYRFESARIGSQRGSVAPDLFLLDQLAALMNFVRTPLDSQLTEPQLSDAQKVVNRFPSGANQFRLAALWAHNSQPARASQTLRTLCAMQRAPTCEQALAAWRVLAEDSPMMQMVVPLPRVDAVR